MMTLPIPTPGQRDILSHTSLLARSTSNVSTRDSSSSDSEDEDENTRVKPSLRPVQREHGRQSLGAAIIPNRRDSASSGHHDDVGAISTPGSAGGERPYGVNGNHHASSHRQDDARRHTFGGPTTSRRDCLISVPRRSNLGYVDDGSNAVAGPSRSAQTPVPAVPALTLASARQPDITRHKRPRSSLGTPTISPNGKRHRRFAPTKTRPTNPLHPPTSAKAVTTPNFLHTAPRSKALPGPSRLSLTHSQGFDPDEPILLLSDDEEDTSAGPETDLGQSGTRNSNHSIPIPSVPIPSVTSRSNIPKSASSPRPHPLGLADPSRRNPLQTQTPSPSLQIGTPSSPNIRAKSISAPPLPIIAGTPLPPLPNAPIKPTEISTQTPTPLPTQSLPPIKSTVPKRSHQAITQPIVRPSRATHVTATKIPVEPQGSGPSTQPQLEDLILHYKQKEAAEAQRLKDLKAVEDDVFTSSGHAGEGDLFDGIDMVEQSDGLDDDDGLDELEGDDDEEMRSDNSPSSNTPTKATNSQPLNQSLSLSQPLSEVSSKAELLLKAKLLLKSLPPSQSPRRLDSHPAASTPLPSMSFTRLPLIQTTPTAPNATTSAQARQAAAEVLQSRIAEEEKLELAATQELERTQEGQESVIKQMSQFEIDAHEYLLLEQANAARAARLEAIQLESDRRKREEEMHATRLDIEKAEEEKRKEAERLRLLEEQKEVELAIAALAEAQRSQLAQEQREAEEAAAAAAAREEDEKVRSLQSKKEAEIAAAAEEKAERLRAEQIRKEAETKAAAEVEAARVKKAKQIAARRLAEEQKKETDAAEARRVAEAEKAAELARVEERGRIAAAEVKFRKQGAAAREKWTAALNEETDRTAQARVAAQQVDSETDIREAGADRVIAALHQLREMKYWSILDCQEGEAESESISRDVWLRAAEAVNSWRIHRLEAWWDRQTFNNWSDSELRLVQEDIQRNLPVGPVREGELRRAAAETGLRTRLQWEALSPETRLARVRGQKLLLQAKVGPKWDANARVAVEDEALRLADEQRNELIRIRYNRTAAAKTLLNVVIAADGSPAHSGSNGSILAPPQQVAISAATTIPLIPLIPTMSITPPIVDRTSHEKERLEGLARLRANQQLLQAGLISTASTIPPTSIPQPDVTAVDTTSASDAAEITPAPKSASVSVGPAGIDALGPSQEDEPDPRVNPRKSRIGFSSQDVEEGDVNDIEYEQPQGQEDDWTEMELPVAGSSATEEQVDSTPVQTGSVPSGIEAATPPPSSPHQASERVDMAQDLALTSRSPLADSQRLLNRCLHLRPSTSTAVDNSHDEALQRASAFANQLGAPPPASAIHCAPLGLPKRPDLALLEAYRASASMKASDELKASRMSARSGPPHAGTYSPSFDVTPTGGQSHYYVPPTSRPGDGTGTTFVPRNPASATDTRIPSNDPNLLGETITPLQPTSISTSLLPGRPNTPAHDDDAYTSDATSSPSSGAQISESSSDDAAPSKRIRRRKGTETSSRPSTRISRQGAQHDRRRSNRATAVKFGYVLPTLLDEDVKESGVRKVFYSNSGRSQEHPPGSLPTPSATESPAPDPEHVSNPQDTIHDISFQSVAGSSRIPLNPATFTRVQPPQSQTHDLKLLEKYGVFIPSMIGRRDNKWTSWSTKIVPGTLHDLMWQLDLIYTPDERERPLMRRAEEDIIWGDMRSISDKRRFVFCCWNRWTLECGALPIDNPVPFLRGWITKYGEIMRFAGIDQEVLDTFHILMRNNLIGIKTNLNACKHWNRHMRFYRLMKAKTLPGDDDFSDAEEFVEKGIIRLKEFEAGGRDHAEVVERRKARGEGRDPILPPEKYYFGKTS